MNDDINRIMKCLTLSVHENEITNLQSLSWAINKLENFPMTFDVLDQSRIGQTLQSVRHSKKISADISERIRYLIKCWRRLLDVNCQSIIPNEIRKGFSSVKPPEMNGIKNGYIKEKISSDIKNLNGINHTNSLEIINHSENERVPISDQNTNKTDEINSTEIIEKEASENELPNCNENQQIKESVLIENSICNESLELEITAKITSEQNPIIEPVPENVTLDGSFNSQTNQENICQEIEQPNLSGVVDENVALNSESKSTNRNQLGKPKLKSTKELLADFSNLIDTDTKNKILLDKITQEDDDPVSYHPEEYKLREIIQQKHLFVESPTKITLDEKQEEEREINEEIDRVIERVIETKKETKCDKLLKRFQSICGIQPTLILKPMVPWKNLKRGIDCSSPYIKLSKVRKIDESENQPKYSIADINDLLQTFEMRAQRKDLITAAIQERKEIKIVDNTQSITDLSLKLKLKIPPQQQKKIKILKIKKRKKKKKKKQPKPKIVIKKPRKPVVKPKPPITNFLDDFPKLPELMEGVEEIIDEDFSINRQEFLDSDDHINRFTYETVEGYNCTKHTQSSELLKLTQMYSLLIDDNYLHVFPWVDLEYPVKSTFSSEADQIIQTALDLSQLYS